MAQPGHTLTSLNGKFQIVAAVTLTDNGISVSLRLTAPPDWGGKSWLIPRVTLYPGESSFYSTRRIFHCLYSATLEELTVAEVESNADNYVVRFADDEDLVVVCEPRGNTCELSILLLSRRVEWVSYAVAYDRTSLQAFSGGVIAMFDEALVKAFPGIS